MNRKELIEPELDNVIEMPTDDIDIQIRFEDIAAYDEAIKACNSVFIERREQYGSFLENVERFPFTHKAGLYEKCMREIFDIENGSIADKDTLIDLVNYALFILAKSIKESEDT